MDLSPTKKVRRFTAAVLTYLFACVAQMVFVWKVFGAPLALSSSLILAFPLIVAVRMRLRWGSVGQREILLLAVLSVFSVTGTACVVQSWYRSGLDYDHAEDVKYAKLGKAMKEDAAFRDLEVNVTKRKHIHWVSGTVESETDLDRLKMLAEGCGITRSLQGPFVHSRSIVVKAKE